MYQIRRLTYLLFLLMTIPVLSFSQVKSVGIRVLQEDSVYSPESGKNTIWLKRKGFKIQVLLQNIDGVYVVASLTDTLYMMPDENGIPHFDALRTLLLEEEKFNKEKELMLCDDCWCFWSYDAEEGAKGFNKKIIQLDSGRVVGIKSVKQLYFTQSKKTIKLKDMRQPLYLFFVAVDELDASGKPVKELLRRRVKIEWIDED